jgi:signal transduction histidine kinase
VEGIVRSIGAEGELKVKAAGGLLSVWCPALSADSSLVDCAVRVRGVISMYAQEGPLLLVGSRQFVQIEERGAQDPFSLEACRISDLDDFRSATALVHRVKVEGTVTYAKEKTIFLQDSSGAVRLLLGGTASVHLGDRLEVVGFPDTNSSIRVLAEPDLRGQSVGPTVSPSKLDLNEVFSQSANGTLVEVSGTLLGQKNQGSVRVLELQSGQHVFEAVLAFKDNHLPLLTANSLLKVTGICLADFIPSPEVNLASLENASMTSMQILLRAPTDIIVQRGPPWWTPVKVGALVGFLLFVLGSTFLWMHLLGRRYERRQMAQLEFSRQILQSQEAERRRIAANLHDSLGQNLLVIKNQVRLAMQPALDRDALSKRLDEISGMASQVIEEVRQVTLDLRPYQLERVGLTQSLRRNIQQASENSPIVFASDVDDVDGLFDNDGEIHIYRILQEALNNVVKHSGATEATAVVRKDVSSVFISVRDNGRGLAGDVANGTELPRAGFGLTGIEERARILRGKALFDSSPGQGFRLSVEIPLPQKV